MSKKHFEAIARILSAASHRPVDDQLPFIRDQLAIMCGQYNAAFDVGRFIAACSS